MQARAVGKPELHKEQSVMVKWYKEELARLNDAALSPTERVVLLGRNQVGAMLVCGQSDPSASPCVTILAVPTITPVDPKEASTLGAPILEDAFEEDITTSHSSHADQPNHVVLAAIGHATRESAQCTPATLVERALPVVCPRGIVFGQKTPGNQFEVLFLPVPCSAPVGLFWTVENLDSQRMYSSLEDCAWSYQPFRTLLDENAEMLDKWFGAVRADTAGHTIELLEGNALLGALPLKTDEKRHLIRDVATVDVHLDMCSTWLWKLWVDYVDVTTTDPIDLKYWRSFRERSLGCYPQRVPGVLAADRHPFIGSVFHPATPWPGVDFTQYFRDEAGVATWGKQYPVTLIPLQEESNFLCKPIESLTATAVAATKTPGMTSVAQQSSSGLVSPPVPPRVHDTGSVPMSQVDPNVAPAPAPASVPPAAHKVSFGE